MDDFQKYVENKSKELRELAATKRNEEWREEKRDAVKNGAPGAGGYAEVGDEAWHKFYAQYEFMETRLARYTFFPHQDRTKGAIETLEKVVGANELPKGGGDHSGVPTEGKLGNRALSTAGFITDLTASEWEGKGATAFFNLVVNLDPAARNQIALGKIIWELATAHHDLLRSTREDIKELLKNLETALENHGDDGGGDFDIKTLLSLLGTAATLTVGATTLKPVAALAAGALSPDEEKGKSRLTNAQGSMIMFGGAAGLNSFIKDGEGKQKKLPLGADTVDGVLDNFLDNLNKIEDSLFDSGEKIEKRSRKNIEFILDNDRNKPVETGSNKPMLVAPRPKAFVDIPPSEVDDGFRPEGTPVPN